MAQIGCDYSFARPSPASLVAAGFTFVMRYLASSTTKRIGATEAAALHAAGLTIGFVFEDNADPLTNNPGLSDLNSGISDATLALGQANALGVPADRPIYVAVDVAPNLNNLTRYQNYFQGWVNTITLARVGFYGGSTLWSPLFTGGYVSGFFWEAAAYSWSNYQIPYPGAIMLQELSSPVPSTDQDIAYLADFGQWPKPASGGSVPPPPGTNNVADVSVTSSFDQPYQQSLITPRDSHDQVIYSVTTSDATLNNGAHLGFYLIPTNVAQQAYPVGIFSYDGGQTWNDFGYQLPIVTTYASIPPGVTLQPLTDSSGNIVFNGVNNTGSTVSLIIKVALLASNSPSPTNLPVKLDQALSYANVSKAIRASPYDPFRLPYASYRRINSATSSSTGNHTVAHGLGVVPNMMFWVKITSGGIQYTTINPVGWQNTGSLGVLGIKMDATNITFHVDAGTYDNLEYRTYKDN